MDSGLRKVQGGLKEPGPLRDVDLPGLAKGITSLVRKQGHISPHGRYVLLRGEGFNSLILRSDWAKIQPLIDDDTFNPLLLPVETGFKVVDSDVRFRSTTIDSHDPLYQRVLLYLRDLFPAKVPTT